MLTANSFRRELARIETRGKYVTKATRRLMRRHGVAAIYSKGKLRGYRLPTGEQVCVKARFPTEDAARAELDTISRLSPRDHKPVRAYECPLCKGWHLTSQP
ncbi:hypothetical protein AAC691_15450 [Nguyenibacter vanlangensis]|uniref:Uncharacterized protein n=1 Tax=Nguyenibacter vanlangensis TaxID=1216886 RepID=A0ABZ3D288_9PROT